MPIAITRRTTIRRISAPGRRDWIRPRAVAMTWPVYGSAVSPSHSPSTSAEGERQAHERLSAVHTHGLRFDANCSILFTELPLLKRPAAARAADGGGVR